MSLLQDIWPAPPDGPASSTRASRRPVWPWLVSVVVAPVGVLAALDEDTFAPYALWGIVLSLGAALVTLTARTRMSGPSVAISLVPGLILCLSAATYLAAALPLEHGESGISPLNGFMLYFGGIWALITIVVCTVLTVARALVRRGLRGSGRGGLT